MSQKKKDLEIQLNCFGLKLDFLQTALVETLRVGVDVGLEFSKICPKFGVLVSSSLEVIEVRKTPKSRYVSKPSISQTTSAKTSKLGARLGIALTNTCAKFGLWTYFGSEKNSLKKQVK